MKNLGKLLIVGVLGAGVAVAEPVDKNESGLVIGGNAQFGQAYQAGAGSTPGAALSLGVDIGYVMKRDTWNRIEIGAEAGFGSYSFEPDGGSEVTIRNMPQVLLKFGYGYSLGEHVFGIFRAGAGFGLGEYEQGSLSSDTSAVIGMLGWDAVLPANDVLDLVFGVNIRTFNTSVDDIQGQSVDSFQLTATMLYAQARLKL